MSELKKSYSSKECTECHRKLKTETNFYQTNNNLIAKDGRLPICKKCIKDKINYNDINTIYTILRQMDLPFIYEYWEIAEKSKNDTFGTYIKNINSLHQMQGMTWVHSIFKPQNKMKDNDTSDVNQSKIIHNLTEYETKWGKGYSKEEYEMLEDIYEDMCLDFDIDNRSQEEYLRTACLYQLKNKQAIASGNASEAQKWGQMFDKYMESGKLKPAQFNRSEMGNVNGFSEFFEFVEKQGFIPKFPDLILDDLDYAIFCFINYNRTLLGYEPAKLGDVKEFMNYDYIKGQEVIMPKHASKKGVNNG
ncbi:hypothetical protein CLG_B2295 [Clostridium phage D-1873]|uniref:Uncharacterized protein n=1 Tax=Clostridium botulinum D str. 1873 TaxID=592027 RepID=A0A9P2G5F8_CLOBO|nr:hypothetical protein [Clostridium botulinum]EES90345.1 hypothetical protein CLG_B2295 [Clostridium phage D-1873]QPW56461.1 hypothetical protein IRP61_11325 [Clostridium botulinum]